jgi:hypothetical protein
MVSFEIEWYSGHNEWKRKGSPWWGWKIHPYRINCAKIRNRRQISKMQLRQLSQSHSTEKKMVKKRNRDPEVLPEAPPAHGGAEDSGSDDVSRSV